MFCLIASVGFLSVLQAINRLRVVGDSFIEINEECLVKKSIRQEFQPCVDIRTYPRYDTHR